MLLEVPSRDLLAKSESLLATPLPTSKTKLIKKIGYHQSTAHPILGGFYCSKQVSSGWLVSALSLFLSLQGSASNILS